MPELWGLHPRFLNHEISDEGRVRRRTPGQGTWPGRILKPRPRCGYLRVVLDDEQIDVHRLVLETFVGPRPHGCETRHANRDTSDNRVSNLSWGTPKENAEDRDRHGTTPYGSRIGTAKLTDTKIKQIREAYATGTTSQLKLAKQWGLAPSNIFSIVNRRTWKHVA